MRSGTSAGGVPKGSSGVEKAFYIKILLTLWFSPLGGNFRLGDCSVIAG